MHRRACKSLCCLEAVPSQLFADGDLSFRPSIGIFSKSLLDVKCRLLSAEKNLVHLKYVCLEGVLNECRNPSSIQLSSWEDSMDSMKPSSLGDDAEGRKADESSYLRPLGSMALRER